MRIRLISQNGFLVLFSASLIFISLLTAGLAVGARAVRYRRAVLHSQFKRTSKQLALGCARVAIGKVVNHPGFGQQNESLFVGLADCTVVMATKQSNDQYKVRVRVRYPRFGSDFSWTDLEVVGELAGAELTFISMKEF